MSKNQYKTVMLNPNDHVAVALEDIPSDTTVTAANKDKTFQVTLKNQIDFGHKFAVVPIEKGTDILKYGEVIGIATADITEGEHVHVHNLIGKRARGDINVNRG